MDEDWNDEQWASDDDPDSEESATQPPERPNGSYRRRGIGTRLGISVPGAIGGVFLVCALAFGASMTGSIRLDSSESAATEPATGDGAEAPALGGIDGVDGPGVDQPGTDGRDNGQPDAGSTDGDGPTATPASEEHPEATPKPTEKPEPTPKPEPKSEPTSEPTPQPKPELVHFHLSVSLHEGAVLIDWTACDAPGAYAYKVVRSSDSTITWPMGEHDVLLKVVGIDGPTKAWDEHPPAGKRSYYRVFCVAAGNDGHTVVGVSNIESIVGPAEPTPTPTPEPQSMSIEVGNGDGGVVISWEACTGDGFSHYRILRKTTGEPTLLAEVANVGDTTFVDTTAESGVEYHYLVQCKGHVGDTYVLLGTTGWAGIVAA